jgi:hypothetical protein
MSLLIMYSNSGQSVWNDAEKYFRELLHDTKKELKTGKPRKLNIK